MKKILSALLVTVQLLSFLSVPASAAYEAPTKFSDVYDYNGSVYSIQYFGTDGGITFRSPEALHPLPEIYLADKYDYIYSFCIYHDKFYLLVSQQASMEMPARIYSCNPDGSGLTLLADNALNFSNVYIVDGVLYYDAFTTNPYYTGPSPEYFSGYYGGIYSINLYDLSWKKISSEPWAYISYCDGDYIYYTVEHYNAYLGYDAYAIKTDGTGKIKANKNSDEFANYSSESRLKFLKGSQYYFLSGNQLYVRNKNGGNSRWIGSISNSVYSAIISVTDEYVYCAALSSNGLYADIYKFKR